MKGKRKSLRFGLMINSLTVEQWQYDTIKNLMDNGMKLSLIIQKNEEFNPFHVSPKNKKQKFGHITYRLWDGFLLHPRSRYLADINKITDGIPTIFCIPNIRNGITYFNELDIQEIRNQNIDFILQFGFEIVAGEVINTTKYGVWRFHLGECFWTFLKGERCNNISLQKLSGNKDKEIFLKTIKTKSILHSYKAHLEQIHYNCSILPLQVCKELINSGELNEEVSNSDDKHTNLPTDLNMLQYYVKSVWRRIVFHINDLFRQEDWNIGFCNNTIEEFISTNDKGALNIQWFKKPKKNCYFADPFIIKTKKDTYIFFEWYSYQKGKADLAVALKSENFNNYHKITSFKEHRSYPYVFENEGLIYCLPEAHQTNKVTLYRFDEEKLTFEEDCVLLKGFPIVDATLYHHDNKWYMFLVNQKRSHTHLEIYYSENLKGPYLPHDNNPVIIDCSNARPAGKIFNHEGKIIRPAQNCTEHYGQSITLQEIETLTDKQFSAKPYSVIEPIKDSDYSKGIHTINSDGGITVFDGKRFVFTVSGFRQQLRQKIHK